jgi:hypothetical protein
MLPSSLGPRFGVERESIRVLSPKMDEFKKKLLEQIRRLSKEGFLGAKVTEESVTYEAVADPIALYAKVVEDLYGRGEPLEAEIEQIRDILCNLLLLVYREARFKDRKLAWDFAKAFTDDFQGHPGSALLTRWNSLAEAAIAFRMVAHSGNRLLVWQQASRLILAYNEFLNGLLGPLIISWRGGLGKPFSLGVIDNAYGSKVTEFRELTGGENGVFYLLVRIARVDLRNAVAHGAVWLDVEAQKVRFTHGNKSKVEAEISTEEFLAFAAIGSHLASAYIVALSAIIVFEADENKSRKRLPLSVRRVLEGKPST